MKSKPVYLYTDGSSLGNPGPGGYGLRLEWAEMSYVKEFSQGFVRTTNNRMELLAVIVGLELLKKQPLEVVVFSDSKYVIDSVDKKWVFGWEKKAFKDKKNSDLWKSHLPRAFSAPFKMKLSFPSQNWSVLCRQWIVVFVAEMLARYFETYHFVRHYLLALHYRRMIIGSRLQS